MLQVYIKYVSSNAFNCVVKRQYVDSVAISDEAVVGFLFVPRFAKFCLCSQAQSFEIGFKKKNG